MQCFTSYSTTTSDVAPREVAPFLKSLRRMLQEESTNILRWTPDGRAFEIHDMHEMMAHVLPRYFKHCKYTSFQRQLNYFNFRKWTKSKAVVCTFSNDFFLRDQPELAWRITRKKSLSPYSLTKYRGSARTSITPFWKKEPIAVQPAPHPIVDSSYMLLPGDSRCRFQFSYTDSFPKQHVLYAQQNRRYDDFSLAVSTDLTSATRSFDPIASGSAEYAEPLDWIDCLLPPVDESYNMCTYSPQIGSVPRRNVEFLPSSCES
ncbi:hypothetical protein PsorP6_001367 [Peronosclerospora sorghi]|uniref:Uncharacterized protein n=1 Tax=Peronosclerospora sorghi TaxID=230839 RepID=A0ACC0WV66_9STRA|nr:hypothetical protein PsorP6_001367 [Peronosclerospora sorghi]